MKNTTKFGIVGIGAASALLAGFAVLGVVGNNGHERSSALTRTGALADQTSSLAAGSPDDEALLWRVANILATPPSVTQPIVGGTGVTSGRGGSATHRAASGSSAAGSAATVPSGTGTWCGCPSAPSGSSASSSGSSTSSAPSGSGSWTGTVTPAGTGSSAGSASSGGTSSAAGASGSTSGVVAGATTAVGTTVGGLVTGVTGLLGH